MQIAHLAQLQSLQILTLLCEVGKDDFIERIMQAVLKLREEHLLESRLWQVVSLHFIEHLVEDWSATVDVLNEQTVNALVSDLLVYLDAEHVTLPLHNLHFCDLSFV